MENTTENVFRFVQLRPAFEPPPGSSIPLIGSTEFARELAPAKPDARVKMARGFLSRADWIEEYVSGDDAQRLIAAHREVLDQDGTVAQMRASAQQVLGSHSPGELRDLRGRLSDVLLALKFAGTAWSGVGRLDSLFRMNTLAVREPSAPVLELKWSEYLRRPLALPRNFGVALGPRRLRRNEEPQPAAPKREVAAEPQRREIQAAIDQLWSQLRQGSLVMPDDNERERPAFALTDRAVAALSARSHAVLDHFGLSASGQPVDQVLTALEARLTTAGYVEPRRPMVGPPPPSGEPPERPYLRDVGIADLLVVKQHLKRYDRVDIAHIENVLKGETKSRNHRDFERIEETVITERETTQERETELETADRFEMNRETARTVQRDQQLGFGLTVSGKYGPTVDFSSNLQGSVSTSTEEVSKNAATYAQDVVSRSLERVVERVREEQIRKVVREREETNLHELTNTGEQHISGVYQFVEKVYESQVFNYGLRQMFDFMVPEPASYVWHLEGIETDYNLPAPPPKLETAAPTPESINLGNYLELAARFGAQGVTPPPPPFIKATVALAHGQSDAEEEGQPQSVTEKDVAVPEGYLPWSASLRALALTDHTLSMAITIGDSQRVWRPTGTEITNVGDDHKIGHTRLTFSLSSISPYDPAANKLAVHVLAYETNSYSVVAELTFLRDDAYTNWQIAMYDKLVTANRDALEKYEQKVEELKAVAEAEAARTTIRFGAPPSQNQRIVRGELKKHCISIVTRQRYEEFDITQDADPPYFEFDEAEEKGAYIRFFEQAFEWDQMQFVFYPYFWSRPTEWANKFLRQDVDPQFLEFLQAGAARVVVPARRGFEIALTHYLETGEIWNGEGEPPVINSPLYVPIVTEIQERSGAPLGEFPVGEPWDTHLPTPLVILRPDDDLPQWTRPNPDVWEWQEAGV